MFIIYYNSNSCTISNFDNFLSIDNILADAKFSKVSSYLFLLKLEENNLETKLFKNICTTQFQAINQSYITLDTSTINLLSIFLSFCTTKVLTTTLIDFSIT